MTTSREYRDFANECVVWAAQSDDPKTKDLFLGLAADWIFAAVITDRIEIEQRRPMPWPQGRDLLVATTPPRQSTIDRHPAPHTPAGADNPLPDG
jgi:hypothetical protein